MPRLRHMFLLFALVSAAQDPPPVTTDPTPRPHRKKVLVIAGSHADGSHDSLPLFAETLRAHGFIPSVIAPPVAPEFSPLGIPGIEQIAAYDLVVVSLHWLTLPDAQLKAFTDYLESGKPILALSSSTRAFAYPRGHHQERLNRSFGPSNLGALDSGAIKGLPSWTATPTGEHPLRSHLPQSLLIHSPMIPVELHGGAKAILEGHADTLNISREIVSIPSAGRGKIITAPVAWSAESKWGNPVIGTTLGHVDDFREPVVLHFLVNAALHLIGQPLVTQPPDALDPQPPASRLQTEMARALRAPALPANFASLSEQYYLRATSREHQALWQGLAIVAYNQGVRPENIAAFLHLFANIASEGRLPPIPDKELKPFITHPAESVRLAALRLCAAGSHIGLLSQLAGMASNSANSTNLRYAAADALGQLSRRIKQDVFITPLLRSSQSLQTRLCGLAAQVHVDPEAAAQSAIELFSRYSTDSNPERALAAFLRIDKAAEPLVAAMKEHPPNEKVSARLRDQLSLGGARLPELREALMPSGEWTTTRKLLLKQRRQVVANAMWEKANPVRGEAVFRRASAACLHCHSVAGAGARVGPALDRAGFMRLGTILNALLDPDDDISKAHSGVKLVDRSGNLIRGVLASETGTHYRVRVLPAGQERLFAKSAFQKHEMPSIMSPFLVDSMSQNDFLDLIAFLRVLGMPGTYGLSDRAPTVRRFGLHALTEGVDPSKVLGGQVEWKPIYASAQGKLPRSELRKIGGRLLVRAELQVHKFGIVRLQADGGDGIESLYANGKEVQGEIQGVSAGPLTYTWLLDTTQLTEDFGVSIQPEVGTDPHLDIINGP